MYAMFARFEIEMTLEQAYSVSEPGMDATDAVNALISQLDLSGLQPDEVRDELREYGAWDEEELADDEENLRRIVWIAGCNLREEDNI
jgi:predicted metal-dependent peptidase